MVQIFVLHPCSLIHFVYLISHNLRYYLYHVKAIIYDTMKKCDNMYPKVFVKRFLFYAAFWGLPLHSWQLPLQQPIYKKGIYSVDAAINALDPFFHVFAHLKVYNAIILMFPFITINRYRTPVTESVNMTPFPVPRISNVSAILLCGYGEYEPI